MTPVVGFMLHDTLCAVPDLMRDLPRGLGTGPGGRYGGGVFRTYQNRLDYKNRLLLKASHE